MILLTTGLRISAALSLTVSQVNLKQWTLTIPPQDDKAKTGYVAGIAPDGRKVLRRLVREAVDGRLFPECLTRHAVYQSTRRLAHRHGIDFQGGAFNHALRHSFATTLVDNGTPIQVISALLGHHDISTTQIYAKVRDTARRNAVDNLKF